MNADDTKRLELARRAWHATTPSDQAVDRAVRRIRRSLNSPKQRAGRRRLPAFAAAALVLGGALAYAASGGLTGDGAFGARRGSAQSGRGSAIPSPPPSSPKPAHGSPRLVQAPSGEAPPKVADEDRASEALTKGAEDPSHLEAEASPPHAPAQPGAGSESQNAGTSRRRRPGADADSGWRQVGEALAAGDEARATRALQMLAREGDAETQAKAGLGLARLAVGAGDCERARRLALGVARTPGLDEKLVQRAHDVVLRCESK